MFCIEIASAQIIFLPVAILASIVDFIFWLGGDGPEVMPVFWRH